MVVDVVVEVSFYRSTVTVIDIRLGRHGGMWRLWSKKMGVVDGDGWGLD